MSACHSITVPKFERLEGGSGTLSIRLHSEGALEAQGIQFLDNGEVAAGPGVAIKRSGRGILVKTRESASKYQRNLACLRPRVDETTVTGGSALLR